MALPSDAAGRTGHSHPARVALVLTSLRKMSRADRSCTETVAQHIRAKGIPPPGCSAGCWGHRHDRSEHWHS